MSIDRSVLSESLKLRALLRQLPDDQLRQIGQSWGFADKDQKATVDKLSGESLSEYLYPRMNSEKYFQQVWDGLSEDERDTMKFLAVHGGVLSREELAQRMFKGAIRAYRKALDNLILKGLCFEATELPGMDRNAEQWLFVPEVFIMFIELPVHCQGFLGSFLRKQSTEELVELGKRVLSLEDHQLPSPMELRYRIRNFLVNPENLRRFIEDLPVEERDVFEDLLGRKGQCLYKDLLDSSGARKVDHSKAEFINALAQTSGVTFTLSQGHNKYMNSMIIPRDIYYVVTRRYQPDVRSLQRIEAMAGVRKDAPSLPPLDNSQDVLRDLSVFLARLDAFQPKRLTSGGINKADLKKLATIFPAMKQGSYVTFLSAYALERGGFVEVAGAWRASEDVPMQLSEASATYMSLFQWWLKTVDWNEFFLEKIVPPGDKPAQLWTDVVELRQAVLKALRLVQKDRWVSYERFWETLAPNLDVSLSRGSGGGGYGGVLSVRDAVGVIIRDSLFFLGVTIIANTGKDEDIADRPGRSTRAKTKDSTGGSASRDFQFRLSPLGRKLVGSAATQLTYNREQDGDPLDGHFMQGAKSVIVQPNHEIVAPRDLTLDSTFLLTRFCNVKNLDVMTTLELNRESLRPMLERGADHKSIVHFLASVSRMELPASVHQLVDECSVKHGEVRLGSGGGYIIADSPGVVESLMRHPRMSPYIKERHGDDLLLLADDTDLNRIARELRNQGHSPQLETGAVHAGQDGRFHLSLTELEMQDIIASVRLLVYVERLLEADLSEGRATTLSHRLQPDSTGFLISGTGVETRSRQLFRKFENAFSRYSEGIVEKYKSQVSKLVSRSSTSRGPSKYQYKGVNPAIEKDDIVQILNFALDYELEVELLYVKQNEQESRLTIIPRSMEGERVYAHNPSTDMDAIYSVARILRARLL